MISNDELLNLLEENTLEYLIVEGSFEPSELEDDFLAGLITEVSPTLKDIHEYIRKLQDHEFDDSI